LIGIRPAMLQGLEHDRHMCLEIFFGDSAPHVLVSLILFANCVVAWRLFSGWTFWVFCGLLGGFFSWHVWLGETESLSCV